MTKVTNALNQSTSYSYFSCTGLKGSLTDPNSQTTSYAYDMFGRQTQINYPDTGQSTYCYTDEGGSTCSQSGPPFSVLTTEKMSPSQNLLMTDSYDGLGRLFQHELNSDSGGADFTVWTYDPIGRIASVSNPYRSGNTVYTTGYSYDALNRTTQVTNSDNSTVATSYTGRATQVTDETGKKRVSQVDGLGRLTYVCEVTSTTLSVGISGSTTPAACNLDIGGAGFLTNYRYDALDDLVSVSESPLNGRSFSYNSLAQLTSATNPESGTDSYTYDADGNLSTKTAPAPNQTGTATVTTTYSYDALNRLTEKSYSDGTTLSTLYGYDISQITMGSQQFTITNTTGRLSWDCVLTSTSHCNPMTAYSYDPMGRISQRWQENPVSNNNIEISYTYDQIGDETTRSISGEGFSEAYDGAGHLTSFTQTIYTDATNPANLLSSATYDPFGHMVFANLGNGLSESWKYDNRARLASEAAGTGCTAGAGTCTTTKYSTALTYLANGNVMSTNDTANGNWAYSYDDFNRLISSTGGPNNYSYAYAYDRFGNRWNQTLNGGCTAGTAACVQFDANNHMTNLVQTYDAAGNVLSDSMHSYRYDAENRLISVDNGSTTYGYDADGQRVFKTTAGALADFIYDRDGHIILNVPFAPTQVELYIGGMHLATKTLNAQGNDTNTYFNHTDWLGTERARTDWAGNLCETIASLPFGDGQNASSTCPEGDVSRMHFTGKERDIESGLDNFGARYNSSSFGRFMSPDPDGAGADAMNPQSWNMYSYVLNNPLIFTDPLGLDCVYLDDNGGTDPNGPGGASIDHSSNLAECNEHGGYWADGYIGSLNDVQTFSNNDNALITSVIGGISAITLASQSQTQGAFGLSDIPLPFFSGQFADPSYFDTSLQLDLAILQQTANELSGVNKLSDCASSAAVSNFVPFGDKLVGDGPKSRLDKPKSAFDAVDNAGKVAKHSEKIARTLYLMEMPNIAEKMAKYGPQIAGLAEDLSPIGYAVGAARTIAQTRTCYEHGGVH